MYEIIDVIKLTQKLISFDTINPPGQENACAKYIGDILKKAGFDVSYYEFAEGRTSLVANLKGDENSQSICFTGHIDTVPLGLAKWECDPFYCEVVDGRIYGRGASDMKSGVAAMIVAALNIAKHPSLKAGLTLAITASEETGCQGAYHLAETKGALGDIGALVVTEPTANYPYVGHRGALWVEAITRGVTAHGSMPEKGVNAIYKAIQAVNKLEKFKFDIPAHDLLGLPTLNVGTISGGININSVPDKTTIGFDVRTTPDQKNEDIFNYLNSYLGDDVELKKIVDVEGVSTDTSSEWINQVFDMMEKYLETRPVAKGITYFTDASVLTRACGNPPTIILGPGEPSMAHKTDEFCYVSKLEDSVKAYIEIANDWCL